MDKINKYIVVTPENLSLAFGPNHEVLIRLRGLEKDLGFAPGIALMISMSGVQTHELAQALIRMADEVLSKLQ